MKKRTWVYLASIIISVISIYWLLNINYDQNLGKTVLARREKVIKIIRMNGKVRLAQKHYATAPFDGKVTDVLVKAGQKVKPGEILARVQNKDLETDLKKKEAEIKSVRAEYEAARQKLSINRMQLELQLKEKWRQMELAREELEKGKELYANGAIAQNELRRLEDSYYRVLNEVEVAKSNLAQEKAEIQKLELQALASKVELIETEIKAINEKLKKAEIRSDQKTTVLKKLVDEGEKVIEGQRLFILGDLSKLEVVAYVNEEELGQIEVGKQVFIYREGNDQKKVKGEIATISHLANDLKNEIGTSVQYEVTVVADNIAGVFFPDENVVVEYLLENNQEMITIPSQAVIYRDDGTYVNVVKGKEKELRKITIGSQGGTKVVVLSGLKEGEQVAIGE
ncbi:efflux RND transporter periplasmic adaptor subunit [Carboxydocella sp. ULO1]|uniref:efflux RND transporter periplasmic adaptor subunit n=1 Tax=Carboxydocella sp. ULO1 TaxID=1926599 RepID=UPI0009ADB468|nr:HlyD family efflux transporter periplasmic adaptor subunit [Carboxydocella sp. ULO1]GAW28633.1 hypothetical protein ULO1_12030 [Carboxydocella sp. ULO1]